MRLAHCPYCKRKMPYTESLLNKTSGQYVCSRCKNESNIHIKKRIIMVFTAVLLSAVIITVLFLTAFSDFLPLGIFLVSVLFVIFFFITPFFIRLVPLKKYMEMQEKAKENEKTAISIEDEYVKTTTRVMPAFSDDEERVPIDKDVFNAIKAERKKIEESIEKTVNENKRAEKISAQPVIFEDNISSTSSTNDLSDDDDDVKIYRR